ncbi:MAG: ABC transporter permease [Symbiobacteriia bacterium]
MFRYVARRIGAGVLVLWIVTTLTFFLMHAIPGGPFTTDKELPAAVMKNINARYHLNDPLFKQYTDYLAHLIHGDLGPSFRYTTENVNQIISRSFPVSATIGSLALVLAVALGIPAGIMAALRQNRWQDNAAMGLTTLLISVPSFIVATLLMYVFAYKLRWLPAALWGTPKQAVMPVIALAGFPMAFVARLVRSNMLEVMGQDYVRTAKAKGMPGYIVIYRHAVRNAILPVVTILGPLTAAILTGSLVVEKIYAIPGLGQHFVNSIFNRDYTVIMGVTVFYSMLVVLVNLLVDLAYVVVDPRIKLGGGSEA